MPITCRWTKRNPPRSFFQWLNETFFLKWKRNEVRVKLVMFIGRIDTDLVKNVISDPHSQKKSFFMCMSLF